MRLSANNHTLRNRNEIQTRFRNGLSVHQYLNPVPEILFVSSYPPRECGIATYTTDIMKALTKKFGNSFKLRVCPLESKHEKHEYPIGIGTSLNTDIPNDFNKIAHEINQNDRISLVIVQHEFGFFEQKEESFIKFLQDINKKVIVVFHTVLPNPNVDHLRNVRRISKETDSILVMTHSSAEILVRDYRISEEKIAIIHHGTHLVEHKNKSVLKQLKGFSGRKVLTTFGLINKGKCIESTLLALPNVIKKHTDVLFLIIGRTHPTVVKQEGESYRDSLKLLIQQLNIEDHVQFINSFVPLSDLLDYLQLTDIYLFTSKDPNQAVSGTFSYAISSGCPIISTPIPHALEVLKDGGGIITAFENPDELEQAINNLLDNDTYRENIINNGIHRMAPTAWENAAISHALLINKINPGSIQLNYMIPEINLSHIKHMTTDFGMIQFSIINQPDIESGYTLDDNARALIALCQKYELFGDQDDLSLIQLYLDFIGYCQQKNGQFLNYVNQQKTFTQQNYTTNLADSNGRAIWALGYLTSLKSILPEGIIEQAEQIFAKALVHIEEVYSTRAMAFIIKGLYYRNAHISSKNERILIELFADRLVKMYQHESDADWNWFESYLTYANSIIPEALACAWNITSNIEYKLISKKSFDFLLNKIFINGNIQVISNKNWLHKDTDETPINSGGEQPIDVAYTIIALEKYWEFFGDNSYKEKLIQAFNWFLGDNHLHQIIYNPCTGGCYDGLEDSYVNLNQGAESTISYLLARLSYEQVCKSQPLLQKYRLEKIKENEN